MTDARSDASPLIRECAKPEWVDEAVTDVLKSLQLVADKRVPEILVPFFLHTAALRLLRCIYGSDLDTAVGVRNHVLRDEQRRIGEDDKNGRP